MATIENHEVNKTIESKNTLWNRIYKFVAIAMSTFQTYTAAFAPLTAMLQRPIHLGFATTLVFLRKPSGDRFIHKIIDILLCIIGIIVCSYWVLNLFSLMERQGSPTSLDLVISVLAVLIVLESTRRTIGPALPIICIFFIFYARFGQYMPSIIGHKGYSWERIVYHLYTNPEGIFGVPLGVSSTYIFIFIMLATFMGKTGMGDVFIKIAYALTGRYTGGPGKAAVVASAMFGTVSGAASANVVATGTFTIPLMKRSGFPPHVAAGIEAAASTGGQIMPPMMGATAFIIADMLGVSYFNVLIAALIPALLYFLSVGAVIHFESGKLGLTAIPNEDLPSFGPVLKKQGYLLIPLILLLILLARDMSPLKAGFWCIVLTFALNILFSKDKLGFKGIQKIFEESASRSLEIATSTACAGIIVGVVSLTGIGLKISSSIIEATGGNLILVLIFSMIASILLGMGLPTSACYIILAVITAPAVIKMGILPMAAHLFIFYFGILSTITPPVALSAYVAASLADANPMKTGFKAVQLGLAGFIVPFMFVFNPSLIMSGEPWEILLALVTTSLGIISLSAGTVGYLSGKLGIGYRIILIFIACLLINSKIFTDIVGIIVLSIIIFLQKKNQTVKTANSNF